MEFAERKIAILPRELALVPIYKDANLSVALVSHIYSIAEIGESCIAHQGANCSNVVEAVPPVLDPVPSQILAFPPCFLCFTLF